uniref:GIY-YIG nuclease family protein n=1 Tax=Gelidibacter sp. TaxID=2018083 RepID=UPI00404AE791
MRGLKGRSNLISIKQDATMTPGFVYILTNKNNTTLYVGVTSDIVYRIKQHKEKQYPKSFTARYNLDKLVYYEVFQMIGDAIGREKQLKAGSRAKKIALIQGMNPEWKDLYEDIVREFGNDGTTKKRRLCEE